MRRSSTQVLITHKTPAVVQATVLALTATVRELPVAVAGPVFIRESAILELFAQASTDEVLDGLSELLELFCEESLATTTVITFIREEASK
jgi:hypothetical protein